jgi:hypothetical protein
MADRLSEKLAEHCGGEPEEYESNIGCICLDEHQTEDEELLEAEELPVEFDEINIEDAEEIQA